MINIVRALIILIFRSAYRAFLPGVFVQREPKAHVSYLPSVLVKGIQGCLGVRLPIEGQSRARPASQLHSAGSLAQPRDPLAAAEVEDVRVTNTLS